MATAVLDLELEHLPSKMTGLESYTSALILVRLGGRPIGQARLPVVDGCIHGPELQAGIVSALEWPFCEQWLRQCLAWEAEFSTINPRPSATVAVCTRDRPEDLHRCLDALLWLPDDGQELLV